MNVIGYVRVSSEEQARSGLGLEAQRETIAAEAARRGWEVTWIEDAGHSARTLRRPGVAHALSLLASPDLSRLGHSGVTAVLAAVEGRVCLRGVTDRPMSLG